MNFRHPEFTPLARSHNVLPYYMERQRGLNIRYVPALKARRVSTDALSACILTPISDLQVFPGGERFVSRL